jgi:hypothetical protein
VKKVVLIVLTCGLFIMSEGCSPQMIGALASPGAEDIKIPAEYDVAAQKPQHLLILVQQSATANPKVNLRLFLTKAAAAVLVGELKFKETNLVPYGDVVKLRKENPNFESMTPPEIGKALNADMVLYLIIEDFQLYGFGETGYHKVDLNVGGAVYDVNGVRVWPTETELKQAKVCLEAPSGNLDNDAARLSQAAVRCIVRHLYDCPKPESRVSEEVTDDTNGTGNF